jgi:hypothetical protein
VKYKKYWRKTLLRGKWGDILLSEVEKDKPKNFLEIGVFCGVTARNICELLSIINNGEFNYYGCDLFGYQKKSLDNEYFPPTLENNLYFSNPIKRFYYDFIMNEKINSIESVTKFLKKFKKNIHLIKGDTRETLKDLPLKQIDYVFLDGGHSYATVKNDLEILINGLKTGAKVLCDDYFGHYKIEEVEKAINEVAAIYKINLIQKYNRFGYFEV